MLLIVHLLLGFLRLREVDYYRDDPLVLRLLGLRKLPNVSTISRALSQTESEGVERFRILSRGLVTEGLIRERLPRLTFDFDGSVLTIKGHAEGTAVGFNKVKKGGRSYLSTILHGGTNRSLTFFTARIMSTTPMEPMNS